MNYIFTLFLMLFLHVVDDFYLQGCLANMKQRSWWQKHESYNSKYEHDYMVALVMHSFSWAFMVMLPIAMVHKFNVGIRFTIMLILNTIIHGIVDDKKANKQKFNLIQDQTIHIFQVVYTSLVLWRNA